MLKLIAPFAFVFLSMGAEGVRAEDTARFVGYTRPGIPNDTEKDGRIIFAAADPDLQKAALGGTVYFQVFEQSGAGGLWGTGFDKLADSFRPGIDANGASSPALDTGAKYLYLYQAVNDRGTKLPIRTISVQLVVDLKEISSWGAFGRLGFALPDGVGANRQGGGIRPISFSNRAGATPEDKVYQSPAPARPVSPTYRLVRVPSQQRAGAARPEKEIVTVDWDALDPAHEPDYALLLSNSDFNKKPCFRAIWNGENVLAERARSTVFGFTSNLPPKLVAVRLRSTGEAASVIQPAAAGLSPAAARDGADAAEGEVPSPFDGRQPAAVAAAAPPTPVLPAPFASPAPALAAPVSPGGGVPPTGVGLGTGPTAAALGSPGSQGGGTNGAQTQNQRQPQAQNQTQTHAQTQTVNQSTTVNVMQQQQQRQRQSQQQQQQQNNTPAMVPEPSGLVLVMIGALWLLWFGYARRFRRGCGVNPPSASSTAS
jgi:hypothetical protein